MRSASADFRRTNSRGIEHRTDVFDRELVQVGERQIERPLRIFVANYSDINLLPPGHAQVGDQFLSDNLRDREFLERRGIEQLKLCIPLKAVRSRECNANRTCCRGRECVMQFVADFQSFVLAPCRTCAFPSWPSTT